MGIVRSGDFYIQMLVSKYFQILFLSFNLNKLWSDKYYMLFLSFKIHYNQIYGLYLNYIGNIVFAL